MNVFYGGTGRHRSPTNFVGRRLVCFLFLAASFLVVQTNSAQADLVQFRLEGNAGIGLLPDNEIGGSTAFGSGSTANGDETGVGITYASDSGLLLVNFDFTGLTGGLNFGAASGIHLHNADSSDPFNTTGAIVFNLNSFSDANVTNFTPQILDGETSGTVTAVVNIGSLESELLSNALYVNIHSTQFPGGELRGNLVAIPEPSSLLGLCAGFALIGFRRRR